MSAHEDGISPQDWLSRAKSNLALAQAGRHVTGVYLKDLCFEAQQAAEKALKALCIYLRSRNLYFGTVLYLVCAGPVG